MSGGNRQAGLTVLGWLIALMVAGAVASVSVNTVPAYVDYRTIVSVLGSLPKDKIKAMSIAEIRTAIRKGLKLNNIRDLDVRKIIKINRTRAATTVALNYEVRNHLIANVDLVMSFNRNFVFTSGGIE